MVLDIIPADKPKKLFRIAMWWLRKEYAKDKNQAQIHDDMVNCGNAVMRSFYKELLSVADNVKEERQARIIREFGEFALWIAYRDTAYRGPFFYMIKHILDMKEELYPVVEKYYKEPEEWYINLWHDSKEITKKQRKEGKITKSELSEAEKYFVPAVGSKRLIETNKELDRERRRRGW